jgi:hypothetical protein
MTTNTGKTPDTVIEYSPAGLPWGSYEVLYYTVDADGGVRRDNESHDRSVGVSSYIERIRLQPNEVAVVTCTSSPGGATVFGSEFARSAWYAYLQE